MRKDINKKSVNIEFNFALLFLKVEKSRKSRFSVVII